MNVDVTVTRAHIKRLKAVSKIEKEREREKMVEGQSLKRP